MKICHVISMKDIKEMGDISRIIYKETIGEHIYCNLYDELPGADIYLLECFKNPKHIKAFREFKAPGKIISLMHSSFPCLPSENSDIVITITNAWQKALHEKEGIESIMIYGGIDVEFYKKAEIDYEKMCFGKISRPERGKYHSEWNYMILRLLEKYDNLKCRIISNEYYKLPIVKHKRMKYIEGIKINDLKRKRKEIVKLGIYADAHNTEEPFIDTFNISMLEAMACGIPVIILGKYQEPMCEVLGKTGMICNSFKEFEAKLEGLLSSGSLRRYFGKQAQARAKDFNKDKMIKKWDKLFKDLYDSNN